MKSMATIAAIVALTALPVCAQRGMAGGGFAGHSAPMGHGGGSGPVSSGFRAPSGSFAYRPPVMGHPFPAGNSGFRPSFAYHYPGHGPNPGRPPFRPIYHRHNIFITSVVPGFVNPAFFWGFPGWGGWGFSDDNDDPPQNPNNEQQAPAQDNWPGDGSGGAPQMPSSFAQSQDGSSQRMPYTSLSAQSTATPAEQNPVTLIFRNGSAPRQVHNYMLTAKTLWVLDQTYQEIPLDQIDIAATVARNREAGIDFHVPDASH